MKSEMATSTNKEFNFNVALRVFQEFKSKQTFQLLAWPSTYSHIRAFLYSSLCGDNFGEVTEQQFSAGCNRFGIDNPTPIMTKRLATYGNTDEIEKTL